MLCGQSRPGQPSLLYADAHCLTHRRSRESWGTCFPPVLGLHQVAFPGRLSGPRSSPQACLPPRSAASPQAASLGAVGPLGRFWGKDRVNL